jgi:hypothetical protein
MTNVGMDSVQAATNTTSGKQISSDERVFMVCSPRSLSISSLHHREAREAWLKSGHLPSLSNRTVEAHAQAAYSTLLNAAVQGSHFGLVPWCVRTDVEGDCGTIISAPAKAP